MPEPLPPIDQRDPKRRTTPRVQLLALIGTLIAVPLVLIVLFLLVALLI
jgi:hypothetical protein